MICRGQKGPAQRRMKIEMRKHEVVDNFNSLVEIIEIVTILCIYSKEYRAYYRYTERMKNSGG